MAPQPLIHRIAADEELNAKVPQGHRARAEENAFLLKVQSSRAFLRLLGLLSKQSGLPVEELQVSVEELVRCCWNEADKAIFGAGGDPAAWRAENERLRKKLDACNRTALQQLAFFRNGADPDGKFEDETITFYEPLQYLDANTKELVLELVVEKLRQLEMGNLPPSLVEALAARARAGPLIAGGTQAEQLKNALEQLHDAFEDLKETRAQLADSEDLVKRLKEMDGDDFYNQHQRELEQLRAEREVLRTAHAEEIAKLAAECSEAMEENVKLTMEIEEVRAVESVDVEMKAAFEQMRAREVLRSSTREDQATQTTLTGPSVEDQDVQIRRQKVMLEELQMKLKEFYEVMKKHGLQDEVSELVEDLGLQEVFSKRTVFERLYNDAAKRAERLEKLRQEITEKREKVTVIVEGADKRALAADRAAEKEEVPVMKAVEQSSLKGLHKLFKDLAAREGAAGRAAAREGAAGRPKALQTSAPQPAGLPLQPVSPQAPSPQLMNPPHPSSPFWVVNAASRLKANVSRAHAHSPPPQHPPSSQHPPMKSSSSMPALAVADPASPVNIPSAASPHGAGFSIKSGTQRSEYGENISHIAVVSPMGPHQQRGFRGGGIQGGIQNLDAAMGPLDAAIEKFSLASPGGCIVRRRQTRRLLV